MWWSLSKAALMARLLLPRRLAAGSLVRSTRYEGLFRRIMRRREMRRPTENDNDITPWLLRIKNVKKSPTMPFRKSDRGEQGGKERDR